MNAHSPAAEPARRSNCRRQLKNTTMEEKRFCETALEGLTSSELNICGGVALAIDLGSIIGIIRKVIDFLDDYSPQLLKGIKDGFGLLK